MYKKSYAFILISFFFFSSGAGAGVAELQTELADVRLKIQEQRQVNHDLRNTLFMKQEEIESLEARLATLENSIASLKAKLDAY